MIRRLAARAGIETAGQISPHSLRVASITGAREAGVPLEDVQDAAGHADPRTTRRYDVAAATAWTATPPTPSPPGSPNRHSISPHPAGPWRRGPRWGPRW